MPAAKAYYLLFATIHEVLRAERLLKEKGLDVEIMPVPRTLSSDCGVCIKSAAGTDVLARLLAGMRSYRCFFFDGVEYRPRGTEQGL